MTAFPDLPIRLIRGDRNRVRQIDAAGMRSGHRDSDKLLGITRVEVLGETAAFRPERQGVTRPEGTFIEFIRPLRAEEKHTAGLDLIQERLPVVVQAQLQMLPVVKTRALDVALGEMESQGSDQVQGAPEAHADSSDGPRIVRDLRMNQHDVERIGFQA